MRIAVAYIGQESDTFNPTPATMESFEAFGLLYSEQLNSLVGIGPVGGFFDAVHNSGRDVEVVPLVKAWAVAGGRITEQTLDTLTRDFTERLAAAGDLDGFAFLMHGACAAAGEDDVEGHMLAAAREVVGDSLPIVVGLDHHANITERMVALSTAIIGHRTQPHDPFETGRLTGGLLLRTVAGEVAPVMAWRKLRLLSHQEQYLTTRGPMKVWFDRARDLENNEGILSVSPFPMQPWLDVEQGGWSVVVVTDNDAALAEARAEEMAELAWSMREEFQVRTSVEPSEAVAKATAHDGLVILSDTGDSVFGGAGGDSNVLLTEILRDGGPKTILPLVDPPAARTLVAAGPGATVEVDLGGVVTRWYEPCRVSVVVRQVEADLVLQLQDSRNDQARHGATAVVDAGPATIVVSELPGVGGNYPALYEHFGIDPRDYSAVVLKTASNFQWFAGLTTEVIRVDSHGPTQSDMRSLPWERVPRPIYPLDAIEDWR
ncbi:M81 family metallopeptidase [Planosporangium thailandense]|uniref:M81 family metallopeptidase n=1 Tax=Planosporangium thailandense TaxID=765197 RepID=A0ABX0Y667_9ACTN|nr:M81 family metallopeptidase [Planosporangium thailandense]NJC72920.1 M81 family metallopeptidase [Planosporangium thailandense]